MAFIAIDMPASSGCSNSLLGVLPGPVRGGLSCVSQGASAQLLLSAAAAESVWLSLRLLLLSFLPEEEQHQTPWTLNIKGPNMKLRAYLNPLAVPPAAARPLRCQLQARHHHQ